MELFSRCSVMVINMHFHTLFVIFNGFSNRNILFKNPTLFDIIILFDHQLLVYQTRDESHWLPDWSIIYSVFNIVYNSLSINTHVMSVSCLEIVFISIPSGCLNRHRVKSTEINIILDTNSLLWCLYWYFSWYIRACEMCVTYAHVLTHFNTHINTS